jgi:uncharacterized protein (TIGR03437 family)
MKVTLCCYIWSAVYTVPLAPVSPGIFAVVDGATNTVISAANPAKRGGSIVIYANGLGAVDSAQATGEPASIAPLARTVAASTVTIGGSTGTMYFSGLTPGSVGLYQLNVGIPSDAPTGSQAVKLAIGGQETSVTLPVQ